MPLALFDLSAVTTSESLALWLWRKINAPPVNSQRPANGDVIEGQGLTVILLLK